MKTIGLIGGMSWESTLLYYKIFNEEIKSRLGGLNSAKCIINSVNFAEIEPLMRKDNWSEIAVIITNIAKSLENTGAELLMMGTNTIHKIADHLEKEIHIPLVHIADTTGEAIKHQNLKKVGLLGTKFTMKEDFYKKRLSNNFDIDVVIPNNEDIELINSIIFKELCLGNFKDKSKQEFLRIIDDLQLAGAEGIVLGCTEIPLIIKQIDLKIPMFNTIRIHAEKAINLSFR